MLNLGIFFHLKCLEGIWFVKSVTSIVLIPLYSNAAYNDCSHIYSVHLLFCAPIMNIFLFFWGLVLRHFSIKNAFKMVSGLCNL